MTIPIKIISKQEFLKLNKKPNQESIWDSIANPWKEYRFKTIPIVSEFLKDKNGIVIDLGCGNGRNMIVNKNISYYGVDFSAVQLKHAEKYIAWNEIKANLFKLDVTKLDKSIFKDNMFNYGLFIAILHCLETNKKRKDALKEFYRILKPGAEGIISVWNSEDKRFDRVGNNGDIYMSWMENRKPYYRYYYLFKKEDFLKIVESVGFKILEFYMPREGDRFSRKNWILRVRK